MKTVHTILILLSVGINCYSQTLDLKSHDYSKADSIAINCPDGNFETPNRLASYLTRELETDHDKFRALFRWITENIEYDRGQTRSGPKKVLEKREAVCQGFSDLLTAMCSSVGIECKTISGFSKTHPNTDIPIKSKESDHAWNVVIIDGLWYLNDVTWATSSYSLEKREHIKEFNEDYFLSDPEFFLLTHFPDDREWTLIDTNFSFRQFKKAPVVYSNHKDFDIKFISTPKGTTKEKFEMTFTSPIDIDWISVVFDSYPNKDIKPHILHDGDLYTIHYEFDKNDRGVYTVYLDGQGIIAFKKK